MASTQGVGAANEDTVHVSPTGVVVLDGLSAPKDLPMGCVHGTPWFVRQLGTTLINLIGDDEVSLQEALRTAIAEVNDLHRDSCDLDQEAVPASTVVMIRERGDVLDYLVLSDNVLVLDLGDDGIQTVVDKRVEEVAADEMQAALQGPTGTPEHAARVSRLVTVQRRLRNKPGGYWVAATDPAAADEAITGSVELARVQQAALLTDGASRLVDSFGALTWHDLLTLLRTEGPAALIARTREAELADPVGERWPRFKRSDDATAAYVKIGQPVPLSSAAQRLERGRTTGSSWGAGERSDGHAAGLADAPPEVAAALGIAAGTKVVRRTRVYRDRHGIVAHSTSWIPREFARVAPELLRGERLQGGTSLDVIARATGRQAVERDCETAARVATPEDAELLELTDEGSHAILVLTALFRDRDGQALEYGVDLGAPGRTRVETSGVGR
ncbi:UTRA domain-containing protein [Streptomyces acidiscabies]|uniref:UTRA domain-containing protein n=3 Tax=Streptomyces acidiscabies TaxID=42234 RepID=A0AAP6BKM9_9ACTN|nr:UTRA domain-containing protein [Streptomyces acidiscabies]MDX2966436.1 UTRA domain-containing protein [Streptomyces acidiscabies]MDX3796382.1 UTRA domain-containing protein [Streptomyces acidiscabies]